MPAYTAPILVSPIIELGLKPVLCDISLKDFNIDLKELDRHINSNTLCILGVHMFGIALNGISHLKENLGAAEVVDMLSDDVMVHIDQILGVSGHD